jgi:hypothetical protein
MVAALAGAVVGVAVAAVIVTGWDDARPPDHEEAAAAFLAAWERSATGTYVVRSDFHRETALGGRLDEVVEVTQRPPDVLVRQHGGISGRVDDERVSCRADPAGEVSCEPAAPVQESYADGVARQLAEWRSYLEGDPHPLYRVRGGDDGCFDLRLTRADPLPPYGRAATFCFDDSSGALRYERIERDEGTDVTEAVEIRTVVRDGDFALAR